MLRVLIADDEFKVCRLIEDLVDWHQYDMKVVDTAYDGLSAFESINKYRPDVVITDIRMPVYDGIELIIKTKEFLPNTHFIIISGFSQFEYAKSAINLGVEDYLLKPIKKDELHQTLLRIQKKCAVSNNLSTFHADDSSIEKEAEEKIKQNFLHEVIISSPSVILQDLPFINKEYHCHFKDGMFTAIKVQTFSNSDYQDLSTFNLIFARIRQMLQNRLTDICHEIIIAGYNNCAYCLFNSDRDHSDMINRQLNMMKVDILHIRAILPQLQIAIGIGNATEQISDVFESFSQAETALLNRTQDSTKTIIYYTPQTDDLKPADIHSPEYRSVILTNIESLDEDSISKLVKDEKTRLMQYKDNGPLIHSSYMEFVNTFLFGFQLIGMDDSLPPLTWFKERYENIFSFDDIFDDLKDILCDFVTRFHEESKNKQSKPIRLAKQYINDHYDLPITLKEVSTYIGLSRIYFSTTFKKETGYNFSDYLINIRIQNAKQLLIHTDMDIYDIAQKIGYTDRKHFSKVFKKICGMTPTEYRKLLG